MYWTVVLKAYPLHVFNQYLGKLNTVVLTDCYIKISPEINGLKQQNLLLHHFCRLGIFEWLGWWIWVRVSWRHQRVSRGNVHLKAKLRGTQMQFHSWGIDRPDNTHSQVHAHDLSTRLPYILIADPLRAHSPGENVREHPTWKPQSFMNSSQKWQLIVSAIFYSLQLSQNSSPHSTARGSTRAQIPGNGVHVQPSLSLPTTNILIRRWKKNTVLVWITLGYSYWGRSWQWMRQMKVLYIEQLCRRSYTVKCDFTSWLLKSSVKSTSKWLRCSQIFVVEISGTTDFYT